MIHILPITNRSLENIVLLATQHEIKINYFGLAGLTDTLSDLT